MDSTDTIDNHPYKDMAIIKRHYEMNDKYKALLGKRFRIFSKIHIYAGCNDLGCPYFTKPNGKKKHTVSGIDKQWLEYWLKESNHENCL